MLQTSNKEVVGLPSWIPKLSDVLSGFGTKPSMNDVVERIFMNTDQLNRWFRCL
jgi:hypothetical protein